MRLRMRLQWPGMAARRVLQQYIALTGMQMLVPHGDRVKPQRGNTDQHTFA